jgi:hypothetical protein
MTEELVQYKTNAQLTVTEVTTLARAMKESGLFPEIKSEAQAFVKIMAGREIGVPPFAAMNGIHVIQNKVAIGAGIMAALVKASAKYDYKVIESTDTVCRLAFYEGGTKLGDEAFTADDAKRAGTQNMGKFPRNMLFNRCMSNGFKKYTPDLFMGPIYDPGELGASVDYETGEVIDAEVVEGTPEPKPEPPAVPNGEEWDAEKFKAAVIERVGHWRKQAEKYMGPPPDMTLWAMVKKLDELCAGEERRHTVLYALFGNQSSKVMDYAQVKTIMEWIDKRGDDVASHRLNLLIGAK